MINKIIKDLKKEIEKWTYPYVDRSGKSSRVQEVYDYKKELLKAKLQAYEDAQKMICKEIKNIQKQLVKNCASYQVCEELLKKFQGEEE